LGRTSQAPSCIFCDSVVRWLHGKKDGLSRVAPGSHAVHWLCRLPSLSQAGTVGAFGERRACRWGLRFNCHGCLACRCRSDAPWWIRRAFGPPPSRRGSHPCSQDPPRPAGIFLPPREKSDKDVCSSFGSSGAEDARHSPYRTAVPVSLLGTRPLAPWLRLAQMTPGSQPLSAGCSGMPFERVHAYLCVPLLSDRVLAGS
jgi:hypothetical protein